MDSFRATLYVVAFRIFRIKSQQKMSTFVDELFESFTISGCIILQIADQEV